MDFVGLLAVEMFLDREGELWVNEGRRAPTTADTTPLKAMCALSLNNTCGRC